MRGGVVSRPRAKSIRRVPRLRNKLKTISAMTSERNSWCFSPMEIGAARRAATAAAAASDNSDAVGANWSMWTRHFRNSTEAATRRTTVTAPHHRRELQFPNKLNFSFPFPRPVHSFQLASLPLVSVPCAHWRTCARSAT